MQTTSSDLRLPNAMSFTLPSILEAGVPPEARGLARDQVRLMVSYAGDNRLFHVRFRDLPYFLSEGDVVVVNTSGTLPASLAARRPNGARLRLHLSTKLPGGQWLVELRRTSGNSTKPFREDVTGERLRLPGGATAHIHTAHRGNYRLWVAGLDLPIPLLDYLGHFGRPIRYSYVAKEWPLDSYQTVYANEPGSAEMPSAGRAFTPELITQLVARGVHVAPLLLHTGVASLEEHEPPYEEFYRVPAATAQLVNLARESGKRIVAVGTTVVRALESVTDEAGRVHPGEGWTTLVITPQRGLRAVNALLTGFHEPRATHLAMLEALAGREHLEISYGEALQESYLWHEFGDLHLLISA